MTTDITELAQSLKAAAVRAQAATEEYASQRISSTAFRLEIEEFESLANKPANILALVEELESAEAKSASEPVFFIEIEGDDWINAGRIPGSKFDFNNLPDGVNKLYAAPQPAPVVAEDFESAWERMRDDRFVHNRSWAEKFWNACRAAMLLENPKSAGESNNCRSNGNMQVVK